MAALASIGLVASGVPAYAVHDLSMELDGDTNVDAGNPLYDWESFFEATPAHTPAQAGDGDIRAMTSALPTDFIARGLRVDYNLPEVTTFATGSKDTLNIGAIPSTTGKGSGTAAGWQCGNSNNLGAKDDLMNVYTVAYRDPLTKHILLYFGAEKSSNLGDNNIGIWFLQDASVGCVVQSNGHNTNFTGHHRAGDVLLTAAFTNGGDTATVEAHVWEKPQGTTENGGEGFLGDAQSGFLCDPLGTDSPTDTDPAAKVGCAITNDVANQPTDGTIDPPWNHPAKTAAPDGSLLDQEFYEGGIDVTKAAANVGVSEPCITSFLADTRSSQSPTATLFDYAFGSFPVCVPSTTLRNTAATADKTTVHAGENVTFTFYEKNDGRVALSSPSVTTDKCATATSSLGTADVAGTAWDERLFNVGDVNGNGLLDPNEEWTFTCTTSFSSGTTGTIHAIGHGFDGDTDVTYYTVGTTTPADCTAGVVVNHKLCDLEERTSVSVTIVNPDTTLTTSASAVITYTFSEYNNGDTPLTSVSISTASGQCDSTPAYQSGDSASTGTVGALDPTETWVFTCTKTLNGPTTDTGTDATATATGTGTGTDGTGVIVTHCTGTQAAPAYKCSTTERDATTVTIHNSARD